MHPSVLLWKLSSNSSVSERNCFRTKTFRFENEGCVTLFSSKYRGCDSPMHFYQKQKALRGHRPHSFRTKIEGSARQHLARAWLCPRTPALSVECTGDPHWPTNLSCALSSYQVEPTARDIPHNYIEIDALQTLYVVRFARHQR